MENKRVLVVEDTKNIQLLLEHILKKEKLNVDIADNGADAIGKLAALGADEKYDLIIADIMMPVMDGIEMLEETYQVRASKEIPVLMLSSLNDREKILVALELGATDYMVKPVDKDILLDKLYSILKNENINFAECPANFSVELNRGPKELKARFLSENKIKIEFETRGQASKSAILKSKFLDKALDEKFEFVIKKVDEANVDGKIIVGYAFVGIDDQIRTKIRSITQRGEEINEDE